MAESVTCCMAWRTRSSPSSMNFKWWKRCSVAQGARREWNIQCWTKSEMCPT